MTCDSVARPVFDLARDPWIPVLYGDGSLRDVSLRTLLADAHLVRDMAPDMPQQKLPLLRLALAVLYRLYDFKDMQEKDLLAFWAETWDRGCFDPDDVDAYFDALPTAFDLFDPERPFYQIPGLEYTEAAGRPYDPVSEAVADCPKPKKFLMSMRARNTLGDISFAEAARWLVFMQAYDPAGIKTPVQGNHHVQKGKVYAPKDSVGTGWMGAIGGVFLRGGTLFETLMLNWVLYDPKRAGDLSYVDDDENPPAWERALPPNPADLCEAYASGVRPGPAALYTWQSRRVRLVPNEQGTAVAGVISCYGDILRPHDFQGSEPMTAWTPSLAQQKKLGSPHVPWMPARHVAGRSLWRGFAALLAVDEDGTDRRPGVVRWRGVVDEYAHLSRPLPALSICAQGITYGTQSSVIEDAIDDSFDVGSSLCKASSGAVDETVKVIADTEECLRALVQFARSVDEIAGSKHGDAGSNAVREQAYSELDDVFRWRIAHFTDDEDVVVYAQAWKRQVHAKLLELGDRYAAYAAAPRFSSHATDRGADRGRPMLSDALRRYRSVLNKLLGALTASGGPQESVVSTSDEEGR